jgi:hypothetical protein
VLAVFGYPGGVRFRGHVRIPPCLFPQHGPGRKHESAIELESWQEEIVGEFPGDFVRGLIPSDGYRGMNRVRRMVGGEEKWYEYPRYLFVNRSADIHRPR